MGPLVSVCVPTYHGAPWLAECLASALAQTQADLEVVVVDDASTDATVAVAEAVAAGDPRVRVHVNDAQRGLAANWNHAVSLARGTWVKFLFQDDVLAPTCLERMCAMRDVDLVVCDRRLEFDADVPDAARAYFAGLPRMADLFGAGGPVAASDVQRALGAHVGVNFFGEPSAVLLKRAAFERFGLFHAGLIQLCDLEYWARVASTVGFAHVAEELATFRVHPRSASATNNASKQFRKDVLDTLILLHDYAFDPHFAALRRGAGVNFSELAYHELTRARRDVAAEPSLRADLDAVLQEHPRLSRPLWRMWHKVRKQLPS